MDILHSQQKFSSIEKFTVSGTIKSKLKGETLIGVSIRAGNYGMSATNMIFTHSALKRAITSKLIGNEKVAARIISGKQGRQYSKSKLTHMETFKVSLMILTFIQGFGAGICFDKALVNLPTRHRIGVIPYANFARANDLGNGLKVYPYIVVGGGFIILLFTAIAYFNDQPAETLYPLYIASLSVIGYLFSTAKAAPIMWSLKKTPNEEVVLKSKLDKFAYWHSWRTWFQIIAFIALIWTVAVSGQR
jgi:hypothetical protein